MASGWLLNKLEWTAVFHAMVSDIGVGLVGRCKCFACEFLIINYLCSCALALFSLIEVDCRCSGLDVDAVERQVYDIVGSPVEQETEEGRLRVGIFLGKHQHVDFEAGLLGADFKDLAVGIRGLVGDDEISKQSQERPKDYEAAGDHSEFVASEPLPSQCFG